MRNDEATPPYETLEIGTPKDYLSDIYRIYFEVGEYQGAALKILTEYAGGKCKSTINQLAHGYEVEMPIQCVPDVVYRLSEKNIAVYQVIRYAKTDNTWV
ncbi:hypothetical protein BHECKSOX_2209 [Bathymodiolus heckerae thiotrophic gill symbiont]|uniref:hypothetical protein n=1 Tax=Bathymodiolus heckerae thiotrophic gill symbiont TaxID=1052212 RepID=UPI0010B580A3|nr:hypothetical protein [Bathymodiolus heckerae thiotrophic gill symbiont]CAC9587814.1 hypothetical protein [uncultured Gammaproteobacteria bacterium]CAC9951500.1 hypothetical protein [uncultured Gammaproteobacteria bacterium]SHN93154.1 hypothetical protein BHECKSOX_2209 [Bathymodiolus heckerae thiotrophic gill symbiont]